MPVYDGKFFAKPLSTMRIEPVANNVPYIVGCNSTEGHGVMNMDFVKSYNSGISKEAYEREFRKLAGNNYCVSIGLQSTPCTVPLYYPKAYIHP